MAKSKKLIPKKYVKLGPLANVFSDPYSGFKIIRNQVLELVTPQEKTSGKIKAAIRGGHLNTATEAEFEAYQKSLLPPEKPAKEIEVQEPTLEEQLDELTNAALLDYYKEHYEVSEEQVVAFDSLKHDERVEELLELDKESEKDKETKEE